MKKVLFGAAVFGAIAICFYAPLPFSDIARPKLLPSVREAYAGSQVFSATSTGNAFTVPGITELLVSAWGAGGGGGGSTSRGTGGGGAGGFASSTIPVTTGEGLTVMVGGAGAGGASTATWYTGGGGGGGYSAVKRTSNSHMLIIAGAGGGGGGGAAGASELGGNGGNGGATTGIAGSNGANAAGGFGGGGKGGNQSGGGAGGNAAGSGANGTTGGSLAGGAGASGASGTNGGGAAGGNGGAAGGHYGSSNTADDEGAGGGGGGYFGGGGGEAADTEGAGGGGGGSSYATTTIAGASSSTPPWISLSDYSSPAGYGATAMSGADIGRDGKPGRVVLRWNIRPGFTASTTVSSNPASQGDNVTFTATASDSDSDSYYLIVCSLESVTKGASGGAPSCGGGGTEYCKSTATASGVATTDCVSTNITSSYGSKNWFAFVCDNHNVGGLSQRCSSADTTNSPLVVIAPPTISFSDNQTFEVGQSTAAISAITITDLSGGAIGTNGIRIAIATSTGVHMLWDADFLATAAGSALTGGHVSNPTTVSYSADGSMLIFPINSAFDAGDSVTISDLSFTSFGGTGVATSSTASSTALWLYIGGASDTSVDASTTQQYVIIKGKITLYDHTLTQVSNKFETGVTSTTTEFFRFKANLAGELASSTMTFNLSDVAGISASDITNAKLYADVGGDGMVTASTSWSGAVWTGVEDSVASMVFDTTNNVLYAGMGYDAGEGDVYRCAATSTTSCDGAGDFSFVFDPTLVSYTNASALAFDSRNNVIYAGMSGNNPGEGDIWRCDTQTGCDQTSDWTLAYDAASPYKEVDSMVFDSKNNVIYAGMGAASVVGSADIYYCKISTNCDQSDDWVQSYNDAAVWRVLSMAFDSVNSVVYAGFGSNTAGDGDIYYCSPGADGVCTSGEWTSSYAEGTKTQVVSLAFDSVNTVIYAGMAYGLYYGDIYRCSPGADGVCTNAEWNTTAFNDEDSSGIYSLVFNSRSNVMFAGIRGLSNGDDIYRCDTSTGCDATADWTLDFNGAGTAVLSLAYDPKYNMVYSGHGWTANQVIRRKFDGDYTALATSTVSISAGSGTIYLQASTTNATSTLLATGDMNYILRATIEGIGAGDAITFSLPTGGVKAYGQNTSNGSTLQLLNVYDSVTDITHTLAYWTTLTQRGGILENDNGSDITLPYTTAQIGERMRVRVQIDTDSGNVATRVLKLQYDKNDSSWADVRPVGEIRPALSEVIKGNMRIGVPEVANCQTGKATTSGMAYEGTARTEPAIIISGSKCTELAFTIDTANAQVSTTYRFRIATTSENIDVVSYSGGSPYPSFTTVSSLDKNYSKAVATTTATSDMRYLFDSAGYSNVNSSDDSREVLSNVILDLNNIDYDASTTAFADITFNETEASAWSGYSVSSGDINGDGYADVIVGSVLNDTTQTDAGVVYVFYGPLATTSVNVAQADVTISETENTALFGNSVSSGDVNGDGYADIISGANLNDTSQTDAGAVYVFYGSSNMSSTMTTSNANVTISETENTAYFGQSVSSGDVNGDGYNDVIIGANQNDADGNTSEDSLNRGRVYVFYGSSNMSSTMDVSSANVTISETENYAQFGYSVSSGDVNKDGYADVIGGALLNDTTQTDAGVVYVFYGSSNLSSTISVSSANVTISEVENDARFGYSVSSGDINGDGYSDVISGAYMNDADETATNDSLDRGRVYVFYGSSTPSSINKTTAQANWIISETETGGYFGNSVSSGDVNGDGYSDVISGAYINNTTQTDAGVVYVFYGSSNLSSTISVSSANVTISEVENDARFGYSVSSGDINGDGYSDVISGAYMNDADGNTAENDLDRGRTYLFWGGRNANSIMDTTGATITISETENSAQFGVGVSFGDVNGDGYADIISGANLNDTSQTDAGVVYIFYGPLATTSMKVADADVTISETENTAYFGMSVSSGDVNGDGYDDVIAGAERNDADGTATNDSLDRGRVYVFYGSSNLSSTISVSSANVTISETEVGGYFGESVSSGDVNGDGYSDVIGGSYLNNTTQTNAGVVYVFYGSSNLSSTISVSSANVTISEVENDARFGNSVSSGDINGDGYDDVIGGANDNDCDGSVADNALDRGRVYVFYGSSNMSSTMDVSSANWRISETQNFSDFGWSVSSGDINGDGYDDVIGGAYAKNRTYVFYGSSTASSIITISSANVTISGTEASANFGVSVSSGDINGDGYGDIITGAERDNTTQTDAGVVYVFYGSSNMSSTISDSSADVQISETGISFYFGYNVSSGDINGDGYDDIIGGAYNNNPGKTYVFLGAKSTSSPVFNFKEKNTSSSANIEISWEGRSSVACTTNDKTVYLQAYNYIALDWDTLTSSTACSTSTDFTLSYTINTDFTNYYDSNYWVNIRAYQEIGNQIFESDYISINFTAVGFPTIFGTLYGSEGTNPITSGKTIKLSVATATPGLFATTTDTGAGTWHVNLTSQTWAGLPLAVWVDNDADVKAYAITKATTTNGNISGLDLYRDRIIVKHEATSGTSTRNVDLQFYDADEDSDIRFTSNTGSLTVFKGQELHVWQEKAFSPGGTVTLHGNASSTSVDGDIHMGSWATTTAGGNITVSGDWTENSNADFIPGAYAVVFNATTSRTINAGGDQFYNLTIGDANGGYATTTSDLGVTNTLEVNSFSQLDIGDGTVASSTVSGTAWIENLGILGSIGTGYLSILNSNFDNYGTLNSKVRFDATSGDITMPNGVYGGIVEIYNNGSTNRIVTMAGNATFSSSLQPRADGSGNITLNAATNNPTVGIVGNLDFTGGGSGSEIIWSGTGKWTVSGTSNTVDFSAGGGGSGTFTASSTNNFIFSGSGTTITSNANSFASTTFSGTINFGDEVFVASSTRISGTINRQAFPLTLTGTGMTLQGGGTAGALLVNGSYTLRTANLTVGTTTIANGGTLTVGSGRYYISTSTLSLGGTLDGTGTTTIQHSNLTTVGTALNSNVRFDATSGNITMPARTYGANIEYYSNSSESARTVTMAEGTHTISGSLLGNGANTQTVSLVNTANPDVNITGNVFFVGSAAKQSISAGSGTWDIDGELNINGGTFTSSSGTLNLAGNYTNTTGTFANNSGTVVLNGTSPQTLSGVMTGTSNAFNNLSVTNTSGINPTTDPAIIFLNAASTTAAFTLAASTTVRFQASATSSFASINWNGVAAVSRIWLRSSTDGVPWGLLIDEASPIASYVNVKDSYATDGSEIDATSNCVDAGGNSHWLFIVVTPTIAAAGNQVFEYGQAMTLMSPITIAATAGSQIAAANGLRIAIATSTVNMRWYNPGTSVYASAIGTAVDGGEISSSPSVSFEGGNSIILLPVSNWTSGNAATISGLYFTNFNRANAAAAGALKIRRQGENDMTDDGADIGHTITIKGKVNQSTPDTVQANAFTTDASSVSNAALFNFKLTPLGEGATTTQIVISIPEAKGFSSSDITNAYIYVDYNGNGIVDADDLAVNGSPVEAVISGGSGAITFTLGLDYATSTPRNYILRGDVSGMSPGDELKFSLAPSGIASTGTTSEVSLTTYGFSTVSYHTKITGFASGVGGGAIGGAVNVLTPVTGGVISAGEVIGEEAGFLPPSSTGALLDSWGTPDKAYVSDNDYATEGTLNDQQDYSGFNFNIPSGDTVTGIEVKLEASALTMGGNIGVEISNNSGSSYTATDNQTAVLDASDVVYRFGSSADKWGTTWTASQVNNSFRLRVTAKGTLNTINLDAIQVKVYHQQTGGGEGGGGEVYNPSKDYLFANLYNALGGLGSELAALRKTIFGF